MSAQHLRAKLHQLTQRISSCGREAHGRRTEHMAGWETPEDRGVLKAFELVGLAEAIRFQIKTQIDARSASRESGH